MKNTGFSEINLSRLKYNGKDPWFCEIAITGKCNFNCTYCNRFNCNVNINELEKYFSTFDKCRHIQITGGEPTLHKDFFDIIKLCKQKSSIIGLSTNGTFGVDNYLKSEADMFSISLDDYDYNILYKRGYRKPDKIVNAIIELAKSKYVNIGVIIDDLNVERIEKIIEYILSLGVSDIKLSTSTKSEVMPIFTKSYKNYPILNYRVENFKKGLQMRGCNSKKCLIARNDLTIVGNNHYPCLVYFREGGIPIGSLTDNVSEQRRLWVENHKPQDDIICKKYCMDFKSEFNCAIEQMEKKNGSE